ncbi:MAG: hypothetical protein KDC88_03510 [Ignavibacteriae bacterium]|nr:hypothetical protein [Ignavibacteriota bacterium]MCB9206789.1 hypothetical protein [Ignavibacteriales bacterium]MCB9210203.1 hypothetical protein [Ignavibacteriales bacterium]MCB9218412.1 hypothetical protein [Ignavibacteriales bacterium]MCB9259582.1 hypothetical protein [Ignavibacteriales bacterium]
MLFTIKGKEGEYIVKNESSILQYKVNENGEQTGESILHIITDSIENQEDRSEIAKKIEERNLI